MAKSVAAIVAIVLLVSSSAFALIDFPAGMVFYPYGGGYNPDGDVIRAKFVFVSFPEDGYSTELTNDLHGQFLPKFDAYFDVMTQGRLRLHPDSAILLPPGEELSAMSPTAQTWQAELAGAAYRSVDSLPIDYQYSFLSDWWISSDGYASPVYAEILHKIWVAHAGTGGDLFPAVGEGELGWQLFFLFLTGPSQSPFVENGTTVGGRPEVHVVTSAVLAGTNAFYDNLQVLHGSAFMGTGQLSLPSGVDPGAVHPMASIRPLIHEFVHTLGLYDGPPNLNGLTQTEAKYFYGNLNMISQAFPHENDECRGVTPFKGFPPIADPHLAKLPWNNLPDGGDVVVDFTNQSRWGEKIYSVGGGGHLYRYSIGTNSIGGQSVPEYFILAYHGGDGLDDQGYVPGQPLVPSQGLAIWHCMGNGRETQHVFDLESAHGLFDYKATGLRTFLPYWEDPAVAAVPNPIDGYDNYDPWEYGAGDYRTDMCYDDGFEGDFFQINATNPNLDKPLFCWKTNPNTNGYSHDEQSSLITRRRPQTEVQPIVVRVRGTGADEQGQYLVADLLVAPAEEVASPAIEGALFEPGVTYPLTLTTDFADAIDSYDVYLSTNGGLNYWYTLAEGHSFGVNDNTFLYTPSADHGTFAGKLKFVFHNTIAPATTEAYVTPGLFHVNAAAFVRGDITYPDGGEVLTAGATSYIEWSNYFGSDPELYPTIQRVDIEFVSECESVPIPIGSYFNPSLTFDPVPENYYDIVWKGGDEYGKVQFTPTSAMLCERGRVRVTFVTDVGAASDESNGELGVYPLPARYISESASEHGIDYDGRARGMSVVYLPGDALPDLCVAIEDPGSVGGLSSQLYRNITVADESIRFLQRTGDEFVAGMLPPVDATSVSAVDFDDDGVAELLFTHVTTPALYKRNAVGVFENLVDDATYFAADEKGMLAGSACASWFDYDHDGDLDLYVGRGFGSTGLGDALFRNYSGDSAAATVFVLDVNSGLTDDTTVTRGVAVADYDGDHYWEVIRGTSYGLERLFAYSETTPGVYVEDGARTLPTSPFLGVSALSWVDIDRDNDLDLVAVDQMATGNGLPGQAFVYKNTSGVLSSAADYALPQDMYTYAAGVFDLDLDGWPDIVQVGAGAESGSILLNLISDTRFDQDFVERGSEAGFSMGGAAYAMSGADFDGDGDIDFVVGRDDLAGRVMRSVSNVGVESPENAWIKFRLIGDGEDNLAAVGARVALSAPGGAPLGTQVIAADSRAGGQADPVLVFGLGDYVGDIFVHVDWPLGLEQDFSVGASFIGSIIDVGQPIGFILDESSIYATTTFDPDYGFIDWTFEWDTDRYTAREYDLVEITSANPTSCGFATMYVTGPLSVDAVRYDVDPVTGQVVFHHRAHVRLEDCYANCTYSYRVQSMDSRFPYPTVSGWRKIVVKACPLSGGQ